MKKRWNSSLEIELEHSWGISSSVRSTSDTPALYYFSLCQNNHIKFT